MLIETGEDRTVFYNVTCDGVIYLYRRLGNVLIPDPESVVFPTHPHVEGSPLQPKVKALPELRLVAVGADGLPLDPLRIRKDNLDTGTVVVLGAWGLDGFWTTSKDRAWVAQNTWSWVCVSGHATRR